MKLFKGFDAVRFPEENLIFVCRDGYLYYIYTPRSNYWRKHRNAGNDYLTLRNYEDVSKEEIMEAMGGVFPKAEKDFMKLCNPAQLCIRDMLDLLIEDYPHYMSDRLIYRTIHRFLLNSDICHKSFEQINTVLEDAKKSNTDNTQVLIHIKELCYKIIGRDIFKKEIGIVDGHDSSSYFWIMPARVVDWSNTNAIDTVAEMRSVEISIEQNDVDQYLTPFLYKHFDPELEANKKRVENWGTDEDGNEHVTYITDFEWYLTHNFYSFDTMKKIIRDIRDTIEALETGRNNEYTAELRKKRGIATYELLYAKDLTEEQVQKYNANRPTENDTEIGLIVDFYHRLLYRLEYMMKVGREKGYDLISFMGP